MVEIGPLFAAGLLYLLALFLIAYAAERGVIPQALARHPAVYVLSLGVYATSWTFYGSVGFAQGHGFGYLAIYLGPSLAFFLAPVLLQPILRLTQEYQLTSLADLFTFRYRNQAVGILVTLFMLAGILPYIALQIRAVTESVQVITQQQAPETLALGLCLTLILFAILFGARHASAREKHEGLVVAVAFESVVKLLALSAVGLYAVYGVFGGWGGVESWLQAHPERLEAMHRPLAADQWTTLIGLSFAAAFLLPRQFHMAFTENPSQRNLSIAGWGFPLLLLAMNALIPLILWAGERLAPTANPDHYVLGLSLESGSAPLLILTFLGGVSAASAMVIVTTLALSAMCLNHLLLPLRYPDPYDDLHRWLLWARRAIIALIVLAGYGFYLLMEKKQGLAQLGLISFVAVAQFLPGIVGLLFWQRATASGFIAGLLGGGAAWGLLLLVPLLERSGLITTPFELQPLLDHAGQDQWTYATLWSLSLNALLFLVVSLLTRPSASEQEAARLCRREASLAPPGIVTGATSAEQFYEQLARTLGPESARREVDQALRDCGLGPGAEAPADLRRLRERLERNLSGLMGPLLARMIIDERLHMDPQAQIALADSMRYFEERLEGSRLQLRGLAAKLDALRRFHRQVLQDLPVGVCSLGPQNEVIGWNQTLATLSGIPGGAAVGLRLHELPAPWSGLLGGFVGTREQRLRKVRIRAQGRQRWLALQKAAIDEPLLGDGGTRGGGRGLVILIEDTTDVQTLEAELAHSERLASIGRLAAGVAHEIGNPVTGIACLAQNMLEEDDPALYREGAQEVLDLTRRISDIVRTLVGFSHGGAPLEHRPAPLDLARCVEEAMRLVRLGSAARPVSLANRVPDGITIDGDRNRLLQVFVNLLNNACQASSAGGAVEVVAEARDGQALIEIADEGCGMAPEVLDRVFEPFFTTKPPGEGTGLGLPMVYKIVQNHAGSIRLSSQPEVGTRVHLALPLAVGIPSPPVTATGGPA